MIPAIKEATRTISKTQGKYMNDITGEHENKELQKTAILGTAHIKMNEKQPLYLRTTDPYDSRRLRLLVFYKIVA